MKNIKRVGIVFLELLVSLAVLSAVAYLWAAASIGTSLVARGIMWGNTDADDCQRFPSRTVRASSEPVYLESVTPDRRTARHPISGQRL